MRSLWVLLAALTALSGCASADVSESVTGATEITTVSEAPTTTVASSTTTPTTTSTTELGRGDWVTAVPDGAGRIYFEGSDRLSQAEPKPVPVWLFQLDEAGQRTGARAVVATASVDFTRKATFSGEVPNELGVPGDHFTFVPFEAGDYEFVVGNYPEELDGPRITIDAAPSSKNDAEPPTPDEQGGQLTQNGLAGVEFGIDPEVALGQLIERFGEPIRDQDWTTDCAGPTAYRVVMWQSTDDYTGPLLVAEFRATLDDPKRARNIELTPEWLSDMRFASYGYSLGRLTPGREQLATLTTPEGVRPGTPVAQLRQVLPDVEFFYNGDDTPLHPNAWFSGGYGGRLSADPTDPAGILLSVTAGRPIHAQPC